MGVNVGFEWPRKCMGLNVRFQWLPFPAGGHTFPYEIGLSSFHLAVSGSALHLFNVMDLYDADLLSPEAASQDPGRVSGKSKAVPPLTPPPAHLLRARDRVKKDIQRRNTRERDHLARYISDTLSKLTVERREQRVIAAVTTKTGASETTVETMVSYMAGKRESWQVDDEEGFWCV